MIRVNFGNMILRSCLDEHEDNNDTSLFQVDIFPY
jgi:hypothetical protein